MSASINVTGADNELYLIAFNSSHSYLVGQIQVQGGYAIDFTINVTAGTYVAPPILQGVPKDPPLTVTTSIPSGQYSLCLVGINWGGPAGFKVSVNGEAIPAANVPSTLGVVWTPPVIPITV